MRIQHSIQIKTTIQDFKKGEKMRVDGVIIVISQDTLERLAGNCMESHNQGLRTTTSTSPYNVIWI